MTIEFARPAIRASDPRIILGVTFEQVLSVTAGIFAPRTIRTDAEHAAHLATASASSATSERATLKRLGADTVEVWRVTPR